MVLRDNGKIKILCFPRRQVESNILYFRVGEMKLQCHCGHKDDTGGDTQTMGSYICFLRCRSGKSEICMSPPSIHPQLIAW